MLSQLDKDSSIVVYHLAYIIVFEDNALLQFAFGCCPVAVTPGYNRPSHESTMAYHHMGKYAWQVL